MSTARAGIDGFDEDISRWQLAVSDRAPSFHRVFDELRALLGERAGDGARTGERLRDAWAARTFRVYYDRPLLFIAALRLDALVGGTAHPLWPALAARVPDPSVVTREALVAALESEPLWRSVRDRFVQTNETSRAVAWLWPAAVVGEGDRARPLALFELGCAAGLNLVADRLAARWNTAAGAPLSTVRGPDVVARVGLDANPLDARRDDDANWLRACIWAGEEQRLARLEASIEALRSSSVTLERGDVTEAPARLRGLAAAVPERTLVFAFQTIVRDYLPEDTRAAHDRGMRRWIEEAPPGSALWVELEIDFADPEKRVHVVAHAREGARSVDLDLGTTGYHPTVVEPNAAALERFARVIAGDARA